VIFGFPSNVKCDRRSRSVSNNGSLFADDATAGERWPSAHIDSNRSRDRRRTGRKCAFLARPLARERGHRTSGEKLTVLHSLASPVPFPLRRPIILRLRYVVQIVGLSRSCDVCYLQFLPILRLFLSAKSSAVLFISIYTQTEMFCLNNHNLIDV